MTDYLPPENTWTAPATPTAVPHSREAEEAVVGAVFINSEVYYDVAAIFELRTIFTFTATNGSGTRLPACMNNASLLTC